ncbi:MAG TPA: L,D-transpeptidase family protein [Micavibrio sp.]|nr:L,D-transpeptidase family protein [Micavibrio sp.]
MKKTGRFLPLLATAIFVFAAPANAAKVYDKDYVGKMEMYRAKYEDTLVHLARKYGLGFVEMRAANPTLDPWIPGEGARVVLPTQSLLPDAPREGIVINLPEMKLYLYQTPGAPPLVYSISPGREGLNTPVGTTTVTSKRENPTWTPTARMLKEDPTLKTFYPAGPDNPMGTHALYVGFPDIRIHGTNKPYAIGRRASSGCIRMYPEAIKDIFPRVPVGTKVTSVDQPVKVGWIDSKMYVEVSPTQEQSLRVEEMGDFKSYEITTADMKRITRKAGPYADRIDWEAVRKAVREHRGYPVAVLDTKGAKGQHVADEMEEKLKSVEAEDKAVVEKRRAAVKAERDAAAAEKAKNDVYAGDRKKKAKKAAVKEVTIITKTESGPRTLNQ